MPNVMTICPETGHVVATGAIMTAKQFARLQSNLAMYCPICRGPHLVTPDQAWLKASPDPAGGPK